ncbi:MAG: hypothetical protein LBJ97_04565 [Mycoplasmataceae bacterium]|nr:hypothetical protein [Mycoplasmataceae bacterium]
MFILIKPKPITKKSRVYLIKSYRDINGKSRHKFMKCYGSYKKLASQNSQFMNVLKQEAKEYENKREIDNKITIDLTRPGNWHNIYNIGYIFVKAVIVAFRHDFLKTIRQLNLGRFYRYLLYRTIYSNQATFQHELFFEGSFNDKIKFPKYIVLQQLTSKLGNASKCGILIVQKLSVYHGDETKDRLFYLLLDENGHPIYFHLIDFKQINLNTTIKGIAQSLEIKFKMKIYLSIHDSVLLHLTTNKPVAHRSWHEYKKNYRMYLKLEINLDFTDYQMKILNHTVVGINKYISLQSAQLPTNVTNDRFQLLGFILAFQIGVFNYFRILTFTKLNIDFLLNDIQETFTQIALNDFTKDYVHIVLNTKNEKWRQLYYLIFDKNDVNNVIINPYYKVVDLDEKVWVSYIAKKYIALVKRKID